MKEQNSLNISNNIKSVIKSHKSDKDRQLHGQEKNDKRRTIVDKTLQIKLEDTKGVIRCHNTNKYTIVVY